MHKFLAMAALAALISSPVLADDHADHAVGDAQEQAEGTTAPTDEAAEGTTATTDEAAEDTMKKEAPVAGE